MCTHFKGTLLRFVLVPWSRFPLTWESAPAPSPFQAKQKNNLDVYVCVCVVSANTCLVCRKECERGNVCVERKMKVETLKSCIGCDMVCAPSQSCATENRLRCTLDRYINKSTAKSTQKKHTHIYIYLFANITLDDMGVRRDTAGVSHSVVVGKLYTRIWVEIKMKIELCRERCPCRLSVILRVRVFSHLSFENKRSQRTFAISIRPKLKPNQIVNTTHTFTAIIKRGIYCDLQHKIILWYIRFF